MTFVESSITDPFVFIAEHLPKLASVPNLYVLFASYRDIPGYAGTVPATRADLHIRIQDRYDSLPLEVAMLGLEALAAGEVEVAALAASQVRSEGRESQAAVEAQVGELPSDRPVLAFVYAGLSAWHEALDFATTIKEQHGGSVVVVTCDCRLDQKLPTFRKLLADGKIDQVVVDHECGGRTAMRSIIDTMVA